MLGYVVEGPGIGSVQDIPEPSIGTYEALVDIVVCGISCDDDQLLRTGAYGQCVDVPSVLGQESVGRVVSIGAGVQNMKPGDLVTQPRAYGSLEVPLALNRGGFAQRGVVTDWEALRELATEDECPSDPAHVVFPASTPPEEIALAIALSATFSVLCKHNLLGKRVGVIGTGAAGLSFIKFARLLGAAHVIGVGERSEQLETALRFGADLVLPGGEDEVDDILAPDPGSLDLVFDSSGDPAMPGRALAWLRSGGRCVIHNPSGHVAQLDLGAIPGEVTVEVARPRETEVMPGVLDLIRRRVIDPDELITHRYGLADIAQGFRDIESGAVLKAMVSTAAL